MEGLIERTARRHASSNIWLPAVAAGCRGQAHWVKDDASAANIDLAAVSATIAGEANMAHDTLVQDEFGPLRGVKIISTGSIVAQPFAAELAAELDAWKDLARHSESRSRQSARLPRSAGTQRPGTAATGRRKSYLASILDLTSSREFSRSERGTFHCILIGRVHGS